MSVSCKRCSTSSILIPCKATCRQREFGPTNSGISFDVVMAAKDAWGASFCCGTSSVIRCDVLQRIGGFPTDALTEDYLVTLKMKSVGFRTVSLNERLSLGLPPEGLKEFVTQPSRCALGFAQICRGPLGPLRRRNGLTPVDRISLIETFLYWSANYSFRLLGIIISRRPPAVRCAGGARRRGRYAVLLFALLCLTGRDHGLDGARPYHAGDVRRDPVAASHANRPGRGPGIVP